MDNNEKYCIFLDIDGTLVGHNHSAYEENIATIKKVRSLGHLVFLNTGRATSFIPDELKNSDIWDGIVSGAGALAKMGDKVLAECLIPYDVAVKYAEYSIENKLPSLIECSDNMYHFGFSKGIVTEAAEIMVADSWVKIDNENIKSVLTPNLCVEKLSILCTDIAELASVVGDDYIVLKLPYHTEIIPKNHGKGKAMLEVAEALGIPKEHTIAVGDSINDLDMIKEAGIGIAMGNASDEVKAVADMIAEDVDSAGVSKALKKIFNIL